MSREDFEELLTIADYIRFDTSRKRGIYRLNLEKCLEKKPSEIIRILSKHNISLNADLLNLLREKKPAAVISLKGSDLVIDGISTVPPEAENLVVWDRQDKLFRAKPMYLSQIVKVFEKYGIKPIITFETEQKISFETSPLFELRPFQKEAYNAWLANDKRGVIVLPTGAGKTYIALWAIHELKLKSLIVVPTIDLLQQWKDKICTMLDVPDEEVGIFGGGKKEIKDVTVITYDSAYLNVHALADKFSLLIADEVHHLASPSYRLIAECMPCTARMGLTATPKRADELHKDLDILIGPTVYKSDTRELVEDGYLADYEIRRIYVDLTPEEAIEYNTLMEKYRRYVDLHCINKDPKEAFKEVVKLSRSDPIAHDVLIARERARQIALGAKNKIRVLEKLLSRYKDKKVIIFSRYTGFVDKISKLFLIPKITHKTSAEERRKILEAFREGRITKIVTGEVLDEGVDVPDASVGIIVSGTGSERQYIQRLGRLLRPKDEKAILIEIITKRTIEVPLSRRRKTELEDA